MAAMANAPTAARAWACRACWHRGEGRREGGEWIGGERAIRPLVDRFYDLMDLEPGYVELRAAHGSTLQDARDKLFWRAGWAGLTISPGAHPGLRARHMPSIGIRSATSGSRHGSGHGRGRVPDDLRARRGSHEHGDWMRNR